MTPFPTPNSTINPNASKVRKQVLIIIKKVIFLLKFIMLSLLSSYLLTTGLSYLRRRVLTVLRGSLHAQ